MEIQNNKKDLYQTVDPFNPRSLFALTSAFYQPNKPIVILLKSTMHSRGLLHTFYFSHVHITAYLMSGFLLVAPSSKGQAFLLFLFFSSIVVQNEGTLSCFITSDLGTNVSSGIRLHLCWCG